MIKRVVIGWDYTNARLFCHLKGWDHRETKLVSTDYFRALRGLGPHVELWVVGPEWRYSLHDWHEIMDVMSALNKSYSYGDTDWLVHGDQHSA